MRTAVAENSRSKKRGLAQARMLASFGNIEFASDVPRRDLGKAHEAHAAVRLTTSGLVGIASREIRSVREGGFESQFVGSAATDGRAFAQPSRWRRKSGLPQARDPLRVYEQNACQCGMCAWAREGTETDA